MIPAENANADACASRREQYTGLGLIDAENSSHPLEA
jgi:hypothetical protein